MLKTLFTLAGGPMAWLGSAASFVVEHWKAFAIAALVLFIFYRGMLFERHGWEKRWAARDAQEQRVNEERRRVNEELQAQYERIEGEAETARAKREVVYKTIEKKVTEYVETHRGDQCGIGDDGVQLITDAVRARRSNPR